MTMMHIYVPFLSIVIYLFVASKCRNLIAISRWYRDGAHFDLNFTLVQGWSSF
jgi:hypothetical protein